MGERSYFEVLLRLLGRQEVLRVLLGAPQLVVLGIDRMGEHGPGQEEGHVGVDVVVDQQRAQTGQAADVVVHAQIGRQEGAQLHQRVLALVVEFAHQLQINK